MTKRTATATPSVVRLSGPQGLVGAVPMYLGFYPTSSLVVLCLRAPRSRVGPVMRVDLFPPEADEPLRQLVSGAVRHADSVSVICYHDDERPACLDILLDALGEAGVPVMAALSVRDGIIRDAASAASERLDPGVPVPDADDEQSRALEAASVMAGRQVLPSREALRGSIAGPAGDRLPAARAAIAAACAELAEYLTGRPVRSMDTALPARIDAAFARARNEHARAGAVPIKTAAELIVLSSDVMCRDLLVARAVGAEDPDVVPVLISVAGWCPDEDAPEICSVLAVAAYRYGDGALAQCAVDRVLTADPHHRLAHLLLSIMAAGLPPAELALMADIAAGPDEPPGWDCWQDDPDDRWCDPPDIDLHDGP